MDLYLSGHEYKYAVEQMLMTLFPNERPVYPKTPPKDRYMIIRLNQGNKITSAVCTIKNGADVFRGLARTTNEHLKDDINKNSVCQHLIKTAIYRASLKSGVPKPVWGALTGVRPGKLLAGLLAQGTDDETALKRFIKEYDVTPQRAELCLVTTRETLKAANSLGERDVCLYVGIPFCPTRCAYCSFVSQSVEKSMKLVAPFLEALEKEIAATAEQVRKNGLRPVSLYMGGGTPTTLSAEQLDRLCTVLEKQFDLTNLREYTVEAGRPDTITEAKLRVLHSHGVNRVSVNPQTMNDHVLEIIGRRHTAADILTALEKVRAVGEFDVNMDLIAGLPGDNVSNFQKTVERVLQLKAENITIHTLSLKKGSKITLEQTEVPKAEKVAEMLDYAGSRLTENGYSPYYLYRQKFMSGGFENVGWARNGCINLYNICIMEELRSILAMGGGGSTKLIRTDGGKNDRLVAPKYPLEYIENIEKTCKDKDQISKFYKNLQSENEGNN